MRLLFLFGIVNGALFPGEILVMYSMLAFVLFAFRNTSIRFLSWIAVFFFLQPVEWTRVIQYFADPDFEGVKNEVGYYWQHITKAQLENSFWNQLIINTQFGHLGTLAWSWSVGRISQTFGLFILGYWIGNTGKNLNLQKLGFSGNE